jgi:hypothetical protein
MKQKNIYLIGNAILAFAFLGVSRAMADSPRTPGKSPHTIFDPTPAGQMRDFDSDRPGVTDSPKTIDAGHLQLEIGLLGYRKPEAAGSSPSSYDFGSVVMRAGLTDSVELQAGLDGYDYEAGAGSEPSRSGVGNATLRLKWNLVGNGEEGYAIGLVPALRLRAIEGGLGIPASFDLPAGYSLAVMPEWDRNKDETGDSYHDELSIGAVLGHKIAGSLSGFGEVQSTSSDEPGSDWAGIAGGGLIYGLTPNLELDAEFRFGVSEAADKLGFAIGAVFRL